jgi:hypothetical protein
MKAFKIFVPDNDGRGAIRMDYQGQVTLDLKADTSWAPSSDIERDSHITLSLGDIKPTGDLHLKLYLVTVEEVSLNDNEHPSDGYKRIIDEREEQELKAMGLSNSMTRRLKGIS